MLPLLLFLCFVLCYNEITFGLRLGDVSVLLVLQLTQVLRGQPVLVQLDPGRHLLVAGRAGGVQVLLQLAVPHRGAVYCAVRRVHVAHRAVEIAQWLLTRFACALHFTDL